MVKGKLPVRFSDVSRPTIPLDFLSTAYRPCPGALVVRFVQILQSAVLRNSPLAVQIHRSPILGKFRDRFAFLIRETTSGERRLHLPRVVTEIWRRIAILLASEVLFDLFLAPISAGKFGIQKITPVNLSETSPSLVGFLNSRSGEIGCFKPEGPTFNRKR